MCKVPILRELFPKSQVCFSKLFLFSLRELELKSPKLGPDLTFDHRSRAGTNFENGSLLNRQKVCVGKSAPERIIAPAGHRRWPPLHCYQAAYIS